MAQQQKPPSSTEQALTLLIDKDGDEALVAGTEWTRRQALVLVKTIAPGLSPEEFQLFAYRCKASKLDPFMGQIHPVTRGQGADRKMSIQTGIDGYRLIAHRTGECAGIDDAVFTYGDDPNRPIAATVNVYRMVQGARQAFTATARWPEYYPGDGGPGFMWRKMPHGQLGKCAEALALRKAFPSDLAGLYVHEEMEQADTPERPQGPSQAAKGLHQRLTELAAKEPSVEPTDAEVVEDNTPDEAEVAAGEAKSMSDDELLQAIIAAEKRLDGQPIVVKTRPTARPAQEAYYVALRLHRTPQALV